MLTYDIFFEPKAFAFPKDSEFRGIFDHYINKLKEGGSVRRYIERFKPFIFCICLHENNVNPPPLVELEREALAGRGQL